MPVDSETHKRGGCQWQPMDLTEARGLDGHIIGATIPENITADVLRDALAGNSPTLPWHQGIPSDLEWDHIQWDDGIRATAYAIIKPFKTMTSGAWPRAGALHRRRRDVVGAGAECL
jgi:hypothetical protein